MSSASTLAVVVSSHGFGHAARTAAVIAALRRRAPSLAIEVFTGTPDWFFEQSLTDLSDIGLHRAETDLGLVQATALEENLDATVERLATWYPLSEERVDAFSERLRAVDCRLVVADIAPLGLAAAKRLGVPSVLVENFTWDWIYRGYGEPRLDPFADAVAPYFASADLRLQAEPACGPELAPRLPPLARRPRQDRATTRQQLGVGQDEPVVLVTMGGVPWRFDDLEAHLARRFGDTDAPWLVVAGGAETEQRIGRAILIPHRSRWYHPDLVHAADAVVAKLGYSTVAEVAQAGIRLGYVPRPRFPEGPELERWVRDHLACRRIEADALADGTWLDALGELLAMPSRPPLGDGADRAAEQILGLLDSRP